MERPTAIVLTLAELKSGAWEEKRVQTSRGVVERANIVGMVVAKPSETEIIVDDGTGALSARAFQKTAVNVGDLVLVIGRPGEGYLILEICKKLQNTNWLKYRKKHLEYFAPKPKGPEKSPFRQILENIKKLDTGAGALTEDVISTVPNGEKVLATLLEEGDVFEIRPGVLKILE